MRTAGGYDAAGNAFMLWMNQHQEGIKRITQYFSNAVCTVAYVLRQLGHHYVGGDVYSGAYQRIWSKVAGGENTNIFTASWEHIATIGLHAIMPILLIWSVADGL